MKIISDCPHVPPPKKQEEFPRHLKSKPTYVLYKTKLDTDFKRELCNSAIKPR
jgi:hypothetical protein